MVTIFGIKFDPLHSRLLQNRHIFIQMGNHAMGDSKMVHHIVPSLIADATDYAPIFEFLCLLFIFGQRLAGYLHMSDEMAST